MNFKINSTPLFTIIFKLKNDNFKTQDFSPLIERVLAGVPNKRAGTKKYCKHFLSYIDPFDNCEVCKMTKETESQIKQNTMFLRFCGY